MEPERVDAKSVSRIRIAACILSKSLGLYVKHSTREPSFYHTVVLPDEDTARKHDDIQRIRNVKKLRVLLLRSLYQPNLLRK